MGSDTWPVVLAASAGAAAGALAAAYVMSCQGVTGSKAADASIDDRSTTSSAGGGAAAYETRKAVDEYLQFHFPVAEELLPYKAGPKEALNFIPRCAVLCESYCEGAADFTAGEHGETTSALDVGCAVGGAVFELARTFKSVVGIDYSHSFVEAGQDMQRRGSRKYEAVLEGDIRMQYTATVAPDIDRSRVTFMQGDACDLPIDLPKFDAVLAANLLCRLPDPSLFIARLPSLVKPGGVVVLVSPYSWLPAWTPKDKWFGAQRNAAGKPVRSADVLSKLMKEQGFQMVHEEDLPFIIREHVRKYQWGCSHAVVWKKPRHSSSAANLAAGC